MAKIKFDEVGSRFFETGVSHGVLYVQDGEGKYKGVAWNGLTSVSESPEGAEVSKIYASDSVYLNLMSPEELNLTIEAYTYPDEFEECDGSKGPAKGVTFGAQTRKKFAFSYQSKIGNDEDAELGYKIHIVYGCLAAPSERSRETVNDSPEAMTMSWEISTTPIAFEEGSGYKPTAHVVIDSRAFIKDGVKDAKLKTIEDTLYGTDEKEPTLLTPAEILEMFKIAG